MGTYRNATADEMSTRLDNVANIIEAAIRTGLAKIRRFSSKLQVQRRAPLLIGFAGLRKRSPTGRRMARA